MAVTYLVDELLTGAKVRANHPDVGGRPTDSEILRMANGAMLGIMTGRLMEAVSAELGAELVVPIVSGQARYSLPQRAAGPKLRYVVISDGANNRYSVTMADAGRYAGRNPQTGGGANPPTGAYIEGNNLILTPTPNGSGYNLVMGYYQRPSQMILATVAVNLVISATTSTITVPSPAGFGTAGTLWDVVQGRPHFQVWNQDLNFLSSASGGGNIVATFTANTVTNAAFIQAGDYVCPANTTCIVPMPVEIQPLLEVRTAMAICRAKNDQSGLLNALKDEAAEMESQLYTFFSNRVESSVETLGANGLMDFAGTSGYGYRNSLF